MWVGGYNDWTHAEQREWDRDLAELEAPSKETTEVLCDKSDTKHWMELAFEDPLFKVTCNSVWGSNIYIVEIKQQPPTIVGERNMDFEIVYPFYMALTEVIEKKRTSRTVTIKLRASSREHWDAVHECEFSTTQWGYQKMDDILEALADELTMKQDLNRGLLVRLWFHEK